MKTATLDRVFSALADPTRRGILARLAEGDCTVGELAEPFDMSPPAISKHLKVLERSGLLERRVEGRMHRCWLVAEPLDEAAKWIERHRQLWEENFDNLEEYLAKKQGQRPREGE